MTQPQPPYGPQRKAITLPDGTVRQKLFWNHPGSVVLLPLMDDQVLMLRQYRFALDQTILEAPAGTRDPQEPALVCAQRELREETGYRAERLVDLGCSWPAPGMTNERMHFFLALGLSPDPLPGDDDEQIEVVAMPLTELLQMAYDGRLEDGKSVVAVVRAHYWLQQNAPD